MVGVSLHLPRFDYIMTVVFSSTSNGQLSKLGEDINCVVSLYVSEVDL